MKNTPFVKAALSSAMALSLLVGTSAPGFAMTSDTSIVNSGDDAEIESSTKSELDVDVNSSNTARIEQEMNVHAMTGGNTASGNIGDGTSINTGAVGVVGQFDAMANTNMTAIQAGMNQGSFNILDVVNTGDDAEIESEVESETDVNVRNRNSADIYQKLNVHAMTGHNTANDNIGGATIESGAVGVSGQFNALANENTTLLDLGTDGAPMVSDVLVTNTGDDMDVEAETESETDISVRNSNRANISQLMDAHIMTGHNWANDNIGDGTGVMSGNAQVGAALSSMANSNTTGISGLYDAGNLFNLSDIVNTGDDLEAETEVETETDIAVSSSNFLYERSRVNVHAMTGHNGTNDNIGTTLATSGTGFAQAGLQSQGNMNDTFLGGMTGIMMALLGM